MVASGKGAVASSGPATSKRISGNFCLTTFIAKSKVGYALVTRESTGEPDYLGADRDVEQPSGTLSIKC